MSHPQVEAPVSDAVRAAVASGWAAYHASVQEHGPADEWDRRVIDTALRAVALQGHPFSVNDFRDLLPEVRKCLISRRLIAAQRDGLIHWTGGVTSSTLGSTKAATVKVYRATRTALANAGATTAPRAKPAPAPTEAATDPGQGDLFELLGAHS